MEQRKRLQSLDILRGMTIMLMIIVNNPGSWQYVYAPLLHAKWHGWTPTDLVFPFFLFIVGTAMWYSFKSTKHQLTTDLSKKIIKRTLLIFAIGLFLNAFPFIDFQAESLRFFGVLQRIALAYCVASFLVLLIPVRVSAIVAAVILLGYWAILQLAGGPQPLSLEDNAVRQLDLFLFGENHLYQGYGIPFDPEGLLSTLPAVVNVLLGYFAGKLIDEASSHKKAVYKLALGGLILVILALLWNPFFPINKPIWSSSYVLLTCGLAAILLGALIWLVDIKGLTTWAQPFLVYGMNPLFIYVLAGIWANLLWLIKLPDGTSIQNVIYGKLLLPWAGEYLASFLFALHLAVIFWIIALILYRRKIFIKL